MGLLGRLFSHYRGQETSELPLAIERAVAKVEPLLKQAGGYPKAYRKPIANALEYARSLSLSVPGPVAVNPESYARDAYVHAIFPSRDNVSEAFRASLAMQEYLQQHRANNEVYALMGMRRREKNIMGMELSGQVIQHDVPQHVVYFVSHTIESPAPSEMLARDRMTWIFFDSLVSKVADHVALRKQEMQIQRLEFDALTASLRTATVQERPALEKELAELLSSMSSVAGALDLSRYVEAFESVLLNPEQHLRLNQYPMILDSMGIQREGDEAKRGEQIIFNELIGFDRRDWTVTLVHCRDIQSETFASRLEAAYRRLSI